MLEIEIWSQFPRVLRAVPLALCQMPFLHRFVLNPHPSPGVLPDGEMERFGVANPKVRSSEGAESKLESRPLGSRAPALKLCGLVGALSAVSLLRCLVLFILLFRFEVMMWSICSLAWECPKSRDFASFTPQCLEQLSHRC